MIPVLSASIPSLLRLLTGLNEPGTLRFLYNTITLSVLYVALGILAYVAATQDVLEEGRDKRRVYV